MINKVKLFIPPVSNEVIVRNNLFTQLNASSQKPLILITAPMGYGKSSLISNWVKQNKHSCFWYSLDSYDNDLHQFLNYFRHLASAENNYFQHQSDLILNGKGEPNIQKCISLFSNYLLELKSDLKIVLDDFHLISNTKIRKFIEALINANIPNVQFVILSRSKSKLPITYWNSKGTMLHLNTNDLEFSIGESQEFIKKNSTLHFSKNQLEIFQSHTEGWISGIKLWLLTNKSESKIIQQISSNKEHASDLIENLIIDILNEFPNKKSIILSLSLFEKFSPQLLEHITESKNDSKIDVIIDELLSSNLFLIPLDNQKNWYRLHHMFREFLNYILEKEFSENQINLLRNKAAQWFENNHLYFECIQQLIYSENIDIAIEKFSDIRNDLITNNEWRTLQNIFNLFSAHHISTSCELQLIEAWILIQQGKILELFDSFENLTKNINNDQSNYKHIYEAELNSLLPYKTYNVNLDFDLCIQQCKYAIENLPNNFEYQLGYAWIFYGGCLQIEGKHSKAVKIITKKVNTTNSKTLRQNLLLGLCFIHWMEGKLTDLKRTANQLINLGKETRNFEILANGYYFLAITSYRLANIDDALSNFKLFNEIRTSSIGAVNYTGAINYVQLLLLLGKLDEAKNILDKLSIEVNNSESDFYSKLVDLAFAEYFLKTNEIETSWLLSKSAKDLPLLPFSNAYAPIFTYLKTLAYKRNLKSEKKLISEIKLFLNKTHNSIYQGHIELYETLFYYENNEEKKALTYLTRLIKKNDNLYLDLPLSDLYMLFEPLLQQVKINVPNNKLLVRIFELKGNKNTIPKFTKRELEILPMLLLSDKEISERLFIAIKTVKRHNGSIYKKLDVKKRLDAFNKAKTLNII